MVLLAIKSQYGKILSRKMVNDSMYAICLTFADALYLDGVMELIDSVPSADVVEAVRCKDCKWHDSVDGPMRQCDITDDDDFCSYGEREGTDR